jgi:hypothetical protein
MGNSFSTNNLFWKKKGKVTEYCKNKYGKDSYYHHNYCQKNGKKIAKITQKQFENLTNITPTEKKKTRSNKTKSNKKNI